MFNPMNNIRGGKRENSGRPNKYGEKTEVITHRVPISKAKKIKEMIKKKLKTLEK